MAFPETVLGTKIELFYDNRWNVITPRSDVRGLGTSDGGIDIQPRGVPDEASRIRPTLAEFSLKNSDSKYSPRNAFGSLYGKLGNNLPVRIITDVADTTSVVDTFSVPGSSGWPTAQSGHVYTSDGGSITDYSVASGTARHAHNAVNTEHRSRLDAVQATDSDLLITGITAATPLAGIVEISARARLSNSRDTYVSGGISIANTTTQVFLREFVSGAVVSLNAAFTTSTVAPGDVFSMRIKFAGRQAFIRVWKVVNPEPTTWTLRTYSVTQLTPGRIELYSWLNPSVTNTLPYTVQYDVIEFNPGIILYTGEIAEWPKKWDTTGSDVWTAITAAGLTRRLRQGNKTLGSPLTRAFSQVDLIGHWTFENLEDLSYGQPILSALPDGVALQRIKPNQHPQFAIPDANLKGSDENSLTGAGAFPTATMVPSPSGNNSVKWFASHLAPVPSNYAAWSLLWWQKTELDPNATNAGFCGGSLFFDVTVVNAGTATKWEIGVSQEIDSGGTGAYLTRCYATRFNNTGGSSVIINGTSTDYIVNWNVFLVSVYQIGGGAIQVDFYGNDGISTGVQIASGTVPATTPGQPTTLSIDVGLGVSLEYSDPAISFGDIVMSAGTILANDPLEINALLIKDVGFNAHSGEPATARAARICFEEQIPLDIWPGITVDTDLGPQEDVNIVTLLEQIALADDALIFELRYDRGFGYKPRSTMYGKNSVLTLDYAAGTLSAVPETTDDDYGVVNQFTAKLQNSKGSVTQQKTTGPLSISDPMASPPGVGLYDDEKEINLESITQLSDYAGFRILRGTWDESRWPEFEVGLHRRIFSTNPALFAAAALIEVGEFLTISNPPPWVTPDPLNLHIRAISHRLTNFLWFVEWSTVPGNPWQQLARPSSNDYGRLDTTQANLVSAITDAATQLVVYTTETEAPSTTPYWTEDPGELNWLAGPGIDLRLNPASRAGGLGGEKVRLPVTLTANDTFTRSGQLGGSVANSGQTWVHTSGTAANAATDGTKANFLHTAAGTTLHETLPAIGADVCAMVDIAFNTSSTTGGNLQALLLIRQIDSINWYAVKLQMPSSGVAEVQVTVVKVIAGASTTISSPNVLKTVPAYTADSFIRVKAVIVNGDIKVKFWLVSLGSSAEPELWQIDLPGVATEILGATDIALRSDRGAGNTTANATMRFDNLQVHPVKVTPVAYDRFARTVVSGLGTANAGGAWIVDGLSTDWNVVPNQATVLLNAAPSGRVAKLDAQTLSNITLSASCALPIPTGGPIRFRLWAGLDSGARSGGFLSFETSTVINVLFFSDANGVFLNVPLSHLLYDVAQRLIRVKFGVFNSGSESIYMLKTWYPSLANEPLQWQVYFVSGVSDQVGAGGYGWGIERTAANTNANLTPSVRDFRVENPQQLTVARSINGVTRAWSTGDDLRLWTPAYLAR